METLNNYQNIWFSWYPVKTESGEWAWLENVGRVFVIDIEDKRMYKYYKIRL